MPRDHYLKRMNAYRPRLIRYLSRHTRDYHTAEDLCQETMFRAYTSLSSLDSRGRLKSWLYSIAYHVAVDWMRSRSTRKRAFTMMSRAIRDRDDGSGVESALIDREERDRIKEEVRRLWGLVRELPPIYREVFEERYRNWHPIAQISKRMGIPEGNVKVRLFRARRMIMKRITNR